MWLQPALFCVATLQPGHGLVNDLITSSVFFSASMLSRAHCEQLLPGWLSPWAKQKVWLQLTQRMEGAAELQGVSALHWQAAERAAAVVAAVGAPAFHERVAFAARSHVGALLVYLETRVFLKRFGWRMILDEIFGEIAAANRAEATEIAVVHVHFDVPSHAVLAHQPAQTNVASLSSEAQLSAA
jgi:hypothetical protein